MTKRRWSVTLYRTEEVDSSATVEVLAETAQEAEKLALEEAENGDVDWEDDNSETKELSAGKPVEGDCDDEDEEDDAVGPYDGGDQ